MKVQSIKQRFGIIGRSAALDNALSTAIRVANTELSVLITGESGVGKEVFSKVIHALSPRKHNKFIAINCGAIPEGTINSELFGHTKGAYTDAKSDRKGYFETVNSGTIFLDEIGEMPLETQTFLLRVLENGEITPVGSSKTIKVDVRVVAATNVHLLDKIKKGKFREDLYYRLSTVPIVVPPLRERTEDIHLLFRKFVYDFAEKHRISPIQLDERAIMLIERYPWPGNIRELRNLADRISVLSEERFITAEQLIEYLPSINQRNLPSIQGSESEKESYAEREILYKLLFDMKNDLNDLKSMFFEMVRDNNLRMPDVSKSSSGQRLLPSFNETKQDYNNYRTNERELDYDEEPEYPAYRPTASTPKPIIIGHGNNSNYNDIEEIEESLSIKDMEKDLITKALKKHRGKRKIAAKELGISERTLYRKISEYGIED